MNLFNADQSILPRAASSEASGPSSETSGRRARASALTLLVLSVAYALAASASLPHRLALGDAIGVFLAGAVPGLVLTLMLWMAQPGLFVQALRRRMIAVSLSGALCVAMLSLVLSGVA